MNIWLNCGCSNSFETEAKAELDFMLNGEGGKWTKVTCPECKTKYTIKLSIELDND
jgi:hypothetical protein